MALQVCGNSCSLLLQVDGGVSHRSLWIPLACFAVELAPTVKKSDGCALSTGSRISASYKHSTQGGGENTSATPSHRVVSARTAGRLETCVPCRHLTKVPHLPRLRLAARGFTCVLSRAVRGRTLRYRITSSNEGRSAACRLVECRNGCVCLHLAR